MDIFSAIAQYSKPFMYRAIACERFDHSSKTIKTHYVHTIFHENTATPLNIKQKNDIRLFN